MSARALCAACRTGRGARDSLLLASPKWTTLPEYFHDWASVAVETSGLRLGRDQVLSLAVVTLDGHGR